MAHRTEVMKISGHGDADSLSAWWWLWLPLAGVIGILAVEYLFPVHARGWIVSERGLVESLHVVIPLASTILALRLLLMPQHRRYRWLWIWLALATLGSFYIAGEEASWGQHYLRWATPESWQAVNDQGETNLHNTSSWFDQKPRILLELGIVIGGIVIPLAALKRPAIRRVRFGIILPPMLCLPSAVLAELTRLSERVLGVVQPGTQLFTRASEVQETYFYVFILLYLIVLGRRLRTAPG